MKRAALATALALAAFTFGSAQNDLSLSGTVFALPGSNLQNTAVIACLLVNDTCDEQRSGLQQLNASGSSARFQIGNLENEEYLLLAWRDLNGNNEADAGDEVGVYQQRGKPALLRPPASNLELRMARFSGDLDSLINQAEQPAASPPPAPTSTSGSGGLSLSGRVRSQAGSNLDGTQVFACVLTADWCDDAKTRGVNMNVDGTFSIPNLERIPYVLFAWRDTDGDGGVSPADELGVYAVNGKPARVTPPQSNLGLILKTGGLVDIDALRGNTNSTGSTSSGTPATNPGGNTAGNTIITNSPLRFTFSKAWRNTGNGSYEATFGKDDPNTAKGLIRVQVYPPRAKSSALLAQTRVVWQQESKGQYDKQGESGGVYARRLPGGLNVGVTFGTLRRSENPNKDDRNNTIIGIYTVMFLVEYGNQVTPMFFVMTRPDVSYAYVTEETEGRGLMLEVMNTLKPKANIAVAQLYTEANLIGKWKETSSTFMSNDWYSPSTGAYVTSTFNASSFSQRLTFQAGGVGLYDATFVRATNSGSSTQSEKSPTKWRIVGDQVIIDRTATGFRSVYQLYGIGKDDRGQPVILTRYLGDKVVFADLDSGPDKLWVVDK
jgi:hypothetical protein